MRRGTVRFRLTALYTGLFLVTATLLLVTVNLLLRRMLANRVDAIESGQPTPSPLPPLPSAGRTGAPRPVESQHTEVVQAVNELGNAVLRFQWVVAAVTVVVLTVVSAAGGWWLAGRLLRRLNDISSTARRLSLSNLHERLALAGPHDELKELGDTFDAMLDRLERSVQSQRQFVANASHELRTPLAIQRAAIQIGLDDPTPQALAQVRAELLVANRRTERLIDGLLLLAQGEHGLDGGEPVRLDDLVHQAVAELSPGDLTITLAAEPFTAWGDPVLLGRLVANLLDNAVRYNVPGGTVRVHLSAAGTLTVANTGPPVPEDRIDELFQPFRRLHATRTRSAEGAGLGLSIIAAIARAHDATVTAMANQDGGLELTVRFPAAVDEDGAVHRDESRSSYRREAVHEEDR